MADSITLIACATPGVYREYAQRMFDSAEAYLDCGLELQTLLLPTRKGRWPAATMFRHHVVLENWYAILGDYVFLVDADMLFVDTVGKEILSWDITAVQHPGYVMSPREQRPYERREFSDCYVPPHLGMLYYAGGFVGGTRDAYEELAREITARIDNDVERGVTPVWHDESALNAVLADRLPSRVLSPSYCFPEDPTWYYTIWPERFEPKLVALDKPQKVREAR